MYDLHSHILPGLDDGARDLNMSIEMAKMAVASGVKAMVATPHCLNSRAREVANAFILLRDSLKELNIELDLYPGMELFGTENTASQLKKRELFTINNSRYPLVEFGFHTDGEEETEILKSLVKAGYTPVVAHPERYIYVQKDPIFMNIWRKMGCLFQINRGSLLGRFGRTEQELALALVDRGFATAVSSDAHSHLMRTPYMGDIKEFISREFDPDAAEYLLEIYPKAIIEDKEIRMGEPIWF